MNEKLRHFQLVVKVLKARSKYLEVKQWFQDTSAEDQKSFVSLCRSFREKPFTAYRGEKNYPRLIEKAVAFEILMSGKSEETLSSNDRVHFDVNNVLTFSTYHASQDRDRMYGFMSQSYVINYCLMRVFYESEYFTATDAIEHTHLFGASMDCRYYIYHLDNLLCWIGKAQQQMKIAKDTNMKHVFYNNIVRALSRMTHKPGADYVMYYKMVNALHDYLDKDFWGYNKTPRLADFSHGKNRHFIFEQRFGGLHGFDFVMKFCLVPLLSILHDYDLKGFSEHNDLKLIKFAKLKSTNLWKSMETSEI